MSLRDMKKGVGNLVISTPLLRLEAQKLRMSLKLSPSRIGDAKYLMDQHLPKSGPLPTPFIKIFTDILTPPLPAPLLM